MYSRGMTTQEQARREGQATCYAYGRDDADLDSSGRVSPTAFAARVVALEADWGQYDVIYNSMLAEVKAWALA